MVNLAPLVARGLAGTPQTRCAAFSKAFTTTNLTSITSTYVPSGTVIPIQTVEECTLLGYDPTVTAAANVCHVALTIATSERSEVNFNIWLPDNWNGRFLGTGTAGFSGCVDFQGLNYGTSLGFATIGTDAGNVGISAIRFLNNPERRADFVDRGIHLEAVVGKDLVKSYYSRPASSSFFFGCSMGGRQGFHEAKNHPADFDGIISCSPGLHLPGHLGWMGYMNWLFLPGQPGAMKASDWALVHAETLRQCDALDGRVDKIIAHPQHCRFRPEALLCRGNATEGCLNAGQVAALPTLYRDFRDTHGGLASTGLAPGSEIAGTGFDLTFGPTVPFFVLESVRYLVYSDPNWQGGLNFSMADVDAILEKMKDLDTWTGDLRAFKGRGGKMIHIHGNEDSLLPPGRAAIQYAMTSNATGASSMDSWYAMYVVPGFQHCSNVPDGREVAWRFGQNGLPWPRVAARNDSTHNALLALVDWVEKGKQPTRLVGMTDTGATRDVCRHPSIGFWVGDEWKCSPR